MFVFRVTDGKQREALKASCIRRRALQLSSSLAAASDRSDGPLIVVPGPLRASPDVDDVTSPTAAVSVLRAHIFIPPKTGKKKNCLNIYTR